MDWLVYKCHHAYVKGQISQRTQLPLEKFSKDQSFKDFSKPDFQKSLFQGGSIDI